MLIAPEQKELTVEAKVATRDIDQISAGLPVDIRFTAFDQRTTPEVEGKVISVAPTRSVTNAPARSIIHPHCAEPGKPRKAEEYQPLSRHAGGSVVKIGERTVMTYLSKPLTDQIYHAFREE